MVGLPTRMGGLDPSRARQRITVTRSRCLRKSIVPFALLKAFGAGSWKKLPKRILAIQDGPVKSRPQIVLGRAVCSARLQFLKQQLRLRNMSLCPSCSLWFSSRRHGTVIRPRAC